MPSPVYWLNFPGLYVRKHYYPYTQIHTLYWPTESACISPNILTGHKLIYCTLFVFHYVWECQSSATHLLTHVLIVTTFQTFRAQQNFAFLHNAFCCAFTIGSAVVLFLQQTRACCECKDNFHSHYSKGSEPSLHLVGYERTALYFLSWKCYLLSSANAVSIDIVGITYIRCSLLLSCIFPNEDMSLKCLNMVRIKCLIHKT